MASVRKVDASHEFPITVGLYQGLSLIPYLFGLMMDKLAKSIQEEVPWFLQMTWFW